MQKKKQKKIRNCERVVIDIETKLTQNCKITEIKFETKPIKPRQNWTKKDAKLWQINKVEAIYGKQWNQIGRK